MSLTPKQVYTENKIRLGYSSLDVGLWQGLCRQAEMEAGKSVEYIHRIIDLAQHTEADVLDIIKSGRTCSGQKSVNDKFMAALYDAMASDDEAEATAAAATVLDLTADEELASESGSYEETSGPFEDRRPSSREAYEIDGFVVEDDDDDIDRVDKVAPAMESSATTIHVSGLAKSNALVGRKRHLKRRLDSIPEETEE